MYSSVYACSYPIQIKTLLSEVSKSKHPDVRNRFAFVRHRRIPGFLPMLDKETHGSVLHV